jgi:hypothetical protein
MPGDDRARICTRCRNQVFDLSAMTRAEAEELLFARTGDLSARFHRRADGTILTSDCPIGARSRRVRRLAVIGVGVGVATAAAATFACADRSAKIRFERPLLAAGDALDRDSKRPTRSADDSKPLLGAGGDPLFNPYRDKRR